MKRRSVIMLGAALLAILSVALYPQIGKKAIRARTYDFLFADGYGSSDISYVEVRHSYIGGLLGYGQWHTSIFFCDEPEVEYSCLLSNDLIPKIVSIYAGGFSPELDEGYTPLHYPE